LKVRRGGCTPVGDQCCEAIEERVKRSSFPRWTERGLCGSGDLEQISTRLGQAPGDQRCDPRVEIRLARPLHVERFEPPRCL
jgi:hypothetical protein